MSSSKIIKKFLPTLLITLVIFLLSGKSEISKSFRGLLGKSEVDEICDKARGGLLKNYKSGPYKGGSKNSEGGKVVLNKYEQSLVDFIRDQKFEYIKDYFPHIGIYLFFLVLDVLLIFFWIGYCICCCCPCCCCSKSNDENDKSKFRKICYYICLGLYLIYIICSIIGLAMSGKMTQGINGVACSFFKFVFHFSDGTGKDYTNLIPWSGTKGVSEILVNISNNSDDIRNIDEINQNYELIKENYNSCENKNSDSFYEESFMKYDNYYNILKDAVRYDPTSYVNDGNNIIKDIDETLDDLKTGTLDDIYDVIKDYINKYCKLFFILFFVINLILGIVGALSLFVYVTIKCQCIRILYHFIWNIQMFCIMISIIFGVVFGVVGTVGKDSTNVVKYILSKENLESDDQILFDFDEDTVDVINVCFNGDGKLANVLLLDKEKDNDNPLSSIENFFIIDKELESFNNSINNHSFSYDNNCNNYLRNLKEGVNLQRQKEKIIFDIFNVESFKNDSSLFEFLNCQYVRSDIEIIIHEFKNKVGGNLVSLSVVILLGCSAAAIEVFFGIIVINRFLNQDQEKGQDDKGENDPNKTKNTNNSNDKIKIGEVNSPKEEKKDNPTIMKNENNTTNQALN